MCFDLKKYEIFLENIRGVANDVEKRKNLAMEVLRHEEQISMYKWIQEVKKERDSEKV